MANGRLNNVLIGPYSSSEIYNNSSGCSASVSIHGQVISSTANSFVSVAATTVNYTSTVYVSTASTTTTLSPYNCLTGVVYCCNATEDYQGYFHQETCCFGISPSYTTSAGCTYTRSYYPCWYTGNNCIYCSYIFSTAVNPEILVARNASFVLQEPEGGSSSGYLRAYKCCSLPDICTRAKHFADVCVCGSCCTATYCCIYGQVHAVDHYSDQQISISNLGAYMCSCTAAAACGSNVTISSNGPSYCGWIMYPCGNCYWFQGPPIFAGCEIFGYTCGYNAYKFKAYTSSCCFACNICQIACAGFASTCSGTLTICTANTNSSIINAIRWMGYNPSDGCNYMMHYAGSSDDGIYKVTGMSTLRTYMYSCGYNCFPCESLSSSSVFTKVASVPSTFTSIAATAFCPSRLFHVDTCKWILGVYSSGWQNYITCDLVNWSRLCDGTCCFLQLTRCGSTYTSSGGSGIYKNTNNYFTCISCSGALEYCVCANQYVKTGVVLSNGDRLYLNNFGSSSMAVNVWGYEG